jgi:PleD family two-component response regulator
VVTVVPPRDRGSDALIEAAQRALAGAKERGGNSVVAGAIG